MPRTPHSQQLSAAQIKAVRIALGMTQEEFAAAIGATVTTVNRSEQGRSAPSRLLCLAIRALARLRRITIPETT